jgi:hypothetical protein
MRLALIVTMAAAMVAAAGPLAAQQAAAEYDQNAPVTLEGTADTVIWSMSQGRLMLKPSSGSQLWEIALPNTQTLLDKGISAEVLTRDVPVKVRAIKAKDAACNPNCKAKAVELTLPRQGKTYALMGAGAAG